MCCTGHGVVCCGREGRGAPCIGVTPIGSLRLHGVGRAFLRSHCSTNDDDEGVIYGTRVAQGMLAGVPHICYTWYAVQRMCLAGCAGPPESYLAALLSATGCVLSQLQQLHRPAHQQLLPCCCAPSSAWSGLQQTVSCPCLPCQAARSRDIHIGSVVNQITSLLVQHLTHEALPF